MIYIYIGMILLAAFPMLLTIWRMRRTATIKKHGIHCNGTISSIRTVRMKSAYIDILTIEYRDRATGQPYPAKATTSRGKYNRGDLIGIAYLPDQPSKYALTDTKGGFTFMLVFCIIIFLFVIFAVYKIDEMVKM
jgi:hypothetical protein